MKKVKEALPAKLLPRKDEITSRFYELAEQHVDDLLNHRADRRFHASDFGRMLFIHPRHLTNTIRLTTGRSPCDIMEEKITDAASRLLKTTRLSVKAIAETFAFNEPTNFTKFFKGMTGITPLQYRRSV